MCKWTLWLGALLLSCVAVPAQTLKVRHDHNPWGKCTGELLVSEEGIEYRTDEKNHSRQWAWGDIQTFDRKSSTEFSVLTYEDQGWSGLGRDRHYNFTVLLDEEPLSEVVFQSISGHLKRPVTDRLPRGIEPEYQIPVKHQHTLGGCEGVLLFGREWIVYQTEHSKDARTWRRDREVESIWSPNKYQLEIHVFEENQRAFDKTRRFRFQLKEPLDQEYYRQLRRDFLPGR